MDVSDETTSPQPEDARKPGKKRSRPRADSSLSESAEADLKAEIKTNDEGDVVEGAQSTKKKAGGSSTPKKKAKAKDEISPSKRAEHLESFHYLTKEDAVKMSTSLLEWYDENQRHMPWRKPSDVYKAKYFSKLKEGEFYDDKTTSFDQAYGALVSELMLQQTQVATVRAYFEKWMKRFPTVESLAEASLEDVNAVWAGLGYYRRAKLIHECAKAIVASPTGKIPQTSVELEKLPGLGRYTAGAIASVVFDEPAPIVDGNVVRVLTRFRAIGGEAKSNRVTKALWDLAAFIVPSQRPGDFNQAMMELGATVCTKANPSCDSCPLASQCAALKEVKSKNWKTELSQWRPSGTSNHEESAEPDIEDLCTLCPPDVIQGTAVTKYPIKGAKKEKKQLTTFVTVVRWREQAQSSSSSSQSWSYLFKKRPEGGLLGGFWEFPSLDVTSNDNETDNIYTKVDESLANSYLLSTFGLSLPTQNETPTPLVSVKLEEGDRSLTETPAKHQNRRFVGVYDHKFTHIDQAVLIEKVDIVGGDIPTLQLSEGVEAKWVPAEQISSLAVSKVTSVCLERVSNPNSVQKKKSASSPKKNASTTNTDKKQPSILTMFSKPQK